MNPTPDPRRRYARALLWTIYVVAPGHGVGFITGVPLGPLDAFALLVIWWLTLVGRRLPGGRTVAVAAVATTLISVAIPGEPGVRGRYYADVNATGGAEPSFTRVDRRLNFSNDGPELPLAGFDDRQAFSVSWDGHWWCAGDGAPRTLYLYAPGASAELVVDGVRVASVTPSDGPATAAATPPRGWHQIYVHVSSPYAAPRHFSAGERIGDRRVPFGGITTRTRRIGPWQLRLLELSDVAKTAFDVCALGLLIWLTVAAARDLVQRAALPGRADRVAVISGLFGLVAIVEACLFAAPFAGRLPASRLAAMQFVFGDYAFGSALLQRLGRSFVVWVPIAVVIAVAGRSVPGRPAPPKREARRRVPDTVPGSVSGSVSGSVPDTVPGSVSGSVSGSVPDTVPGSVPDPVTVLRRWWRERSQKLLTGRLTSIIASGAMVTAVSLYTFVIRTRGISGHFLLMGDQIRDWTIALRPFANLPLVGAPSNGGGNSFGPVYYWVLWLARVTIGPFVENLPHAGGIGLAAAQSFADAVLCVGIRKASGSWIYAVATVLIIASCPFDLALSSVIWNPVLAVAFVKIVIGLVLCWQTEWTRPKRALVIACAWLAVQAHSPAMPVAIAIFIGLVAGHARAHATRPLVVVAEIVGVVLLLQLPAALAPASIQPTRVVSVLQHPQQLRLFEALRYVGGSMEAMAAAPFNLPHTSVILLSAATALSVAIGIWTPIASATIWPLLLAILLWSIWQGPYDSYLFMTIVPSAILMVTWTTRLLPTPTSRAAAALVLLALALLIQRPRIERATTLFRLPGYGALVSGARTVVRRGEAIRRVDAPFLHGASDPEFVFQILGGRIDRNAPVAATLSEFGEVTYVR